MHVRFDDKEPGDEIPEQADIAGSEDSDDYSEPDQISELNGTSEAVTAPEIQKLQQLLMFQLPKPLKKITMFLSKLSSPETHSNTSLHILRIK